MKTTRLILIFILSSIIALGNGQSTAYFPNTLMLKVKESYRSACSAEGINDPNFQDLFRGIGLETINKKFPNHQPPLNTHNEMGVKLADLSLIYKITYSGSIDAREMGARLLATGFFEYAEPEYIQHVLYNPNDPEIGSQYHLTNINAYQAWDVSQGDTSIVIGISDTGIELTHDDLKDNIKYNTADPINGIDDDGDGYLDNYQGWDFGSNDNDPSLEPSSKHGQSVTGTAAAITDNGLMVSGSAFKTRILPIKILSASGFLLNTYESIVYAADHGCKIINCSWGSANSYTQYGQDVVTYAAINNNCMVVGAAGNDNNEGVFYPASFDFAISVGATTASNTKWDFSPTYGSNYNEHIEICAPGHNIYTVTSGNTTIGGRAGTSFSAPLVSGAGVVAWANNPGFTSGMQVIELLKATADSLEFIPGNGAWSGKLGEGLLNMNRSVTETGFPGLYMYDFQFTGNNQNRFAPGDTVDISGTILNYLDASSAGAVATLSTTSPFINIINPTIPIGVIASQGSLDLSPTPFRVEVLPGMPASELVEFIFTMTDGTYNTKRFAEENFNLDFIDLTENDLGIMVGESGKMAYNSTVATTPGIGITYEGSPSLVYNMGFIATDNSDQVSFVLDGDFETESTLRFVDPGAESDADVYTHFNDNPADSSLDISVKQKTLAWNDTKRDDFVILEYTVINNSGSTYNNMHLGMFADWDIGVYTNNEANWDATTNTAYANEVGGIYGAIHLLNGTGIQHYAVTNDGSSGAVNIYDGLSEAEQFSSISSGNARTSAPVGDVSHFAGNGPFTIADGDSVVFAVAIIAGDNLTEIQTSALEADTIYDEIRTVIPSLVSTTDPSCNGYSDGDATVAATGGIGTYTYLWSDPLAQTTATASGLAAGSYYCVVTDSIGQFDTLFNITLNDPAPLSINLGNDTTLCDGESLILDASIPGSTYLWSTGHADSTLTVDTAAQYDVRVTNGIGCIARDTIQIYTSTSPIVDIGSDSTKCSGDSVILDAGNPGLNFLWSNGGTGQTETFNGTGTHWVRVTNFNGCATRDSMDLTVVSFPVVDLGPDVNACDSYSGTLDAGNPGADYLWSTGGTGQTIAISTSNTYFVEVSYDGACATSDTMVLTIEPTPNVDLGPDTTVCRSSDYTLDAGVGSSYLWNNFKTTQTIVVDIEGEYFVKVGATCTDEDTVNITYLDDPVVWYNSNFQTGYLPGHGDVLLDFGNPVGGVYSGTAVTGNTFNTVTSGTGNFRIDYTYTSPTTGCSAGTWVNIWVDPDVSTFEVADGKINIFPNPFNDIITVEFSGNFEEANGQVLLYDGLGQLVAKQNIQSWSGTTSLNLNVSHLSKGAYYLVLQGDKMFSKHKLVK